MDSFDRSAKNNLVEELGQVQDEEKYQLLSKKSYPHALQSKGLYRGQKRSYVSNLYSLLIFLIGIPATFLVFVGQTEQYLYLDSALVGGAYLTSFLFSWFYFTQSNFWELFSVLASCNTRRREILFDRSHRLARNIQILFLATFSVTLVFGVAADSYLFSVIHRDSPIWKLVLFSFSDLVLYEVTMLTGALFCSICFVLDSSVEGYVNDLVHQEMPIDLCFNKHFHLKQTTQETMKLWKWYLAPIILLCSMSVVLFLYNLATEAYPEFYTFAQHLDNSIMAATHFLLMTLCLFPAAMLTKKFESILDMVNALRPLKTQGKLQESQQLSNSDISSFLIYLSTSKSGVDILGIQINVGLLTSGYYALISAVILVFKSKYDYITKNLW